MDNSCLKMTLEFGNKNPRNFTCGSKKSLLSSTKGTMQRPTMHSSHGNKINYVPKPLSNFNFYTYVANFRQHCGHAFLNSKDF